MRQANINKPAETAQAAPVEGQAMAAVAAVAGRHDLINLAVGRPAVQSSVAAGAAADDAQRAVSGVVVAAGGFCTGHEPAPFWQVDLLAVFNLRRVEIYNREGSWAYRAVPLAVEVSTDGAVWRLLAAVHYVFGGVVNGEPLVLAFRQAVKARHLRLRRTGLPEVFHLDQVMVFTGIGDLPSGAQLHQDAWVAQMTGGRRGGVFLDIGATDGVRMNNSLMLEQQFGWTGACVEPNPTFYAELAANRAALVFERAVFPGPARRLAFLAQAELGTLLPFADSDMFAKERAKFAAETGGIEVETISPAELLRQCGGWAAVDYLSIDTEGSEWEILRSFDFTRFRAGLITIEHNDAVEKRGLIAGLLGGLGYLAMAAHFDDWYYHPAWLAALNGAVVVDFAAVCAAFAAREGFPQSYHEGRSR